MTGTPDERLYMLHSASEKLDNETTLFLDQLHERQELKDVDWEQVT